MAICLLTVSAALLWSRPSSAFKPRGWVARADAINDCKAALDDNGGLVGIFDVSTLPEASSPTAILVSGRALFRTGEGAMISRHFRCGYDGALGGVVNAELGRL